MNVLTTNRRKLAIITLLAWPLGLFLVVANMELDPVTLPVFAVLDSLYVGMVLALLHAWDARRDPMAAALIVTAVGIFAGAGFTGGPTADDPDLMMLNTAVLGVVGIALLWIAIQLVVEHRVSSRLGAAVPALVLFAMGSTLWIANLIARCAVVFSGASEQQAAVEDKAWFAYEYLRELEPDPDFMSYLLVWMDLLQIAYVVCAYVVFAALAKLMERHQRVSPRAGRAIAIGARTGAAIAVLGVVFAALLPRDADLVPAWAAFVVSIPFMTTLAPFALGVAMLHRRGGD